MPQTSPNDGDAAPQEESHTLAQLFFRMPTQQLRQELEEFRVKYEAQFGETELTRYYTSQWPSDRQKWLSEHFPKRYYDGLPPFVQAWLKEKMRAAQMAGKLDDASDMLIRLYVSGHMNQKHNGPSR